MKKFTWNSILVCLFFFIPFLSIAQNGPGNDLSPDEIQQYKKQISFLINYLQETFNFLGNPESITKEKEIIINESYLKIFKNDKVQVEDDLDDGREVPIHKDVQAYLKDIEFFFRSVKFEFVIVDVNHFVNHDNLHYFKVAFNRDMSGITVSGDTVNSRKPRYMEVNLDLANNDLKIASIYTTKLNEKEEVKNWWNTMSTEWKVFFGKEVFINDSIELASVSLIGDSLILASKEKDDMLADTAVKNDMELHAERQPDFNLSFVVDTVFLDTKPVFAALQEILNRQKTDVSFNKNISTLEPLGELTKLREVNCSNTLVVSLFPLRNLNQLEILNCSESPANDISPIQYTLSVKELNCSYTLINDLSSIAGLSNLEKFECAGNRIENLNFVENMSNLKFLDCSNTHIRDIEPIEKLSQLETLDISGTRVKNLKPLAELPKLKYLNCENSWIISLEDLKNLKSLEVLRISQTQISNLEPLNELENLRKIYCDDTQIDKDKTIQFMRTHPGCLVIFASQELLNGWSELDDTWKQIAHEIADLSDNPTKEELHELIKTEVLDLSDTEDISSLESIRKLYNLKKLNLTSLKVEDYNPVGDAIELEELNLSNTNVSNLDFVKNLTRLKVLNIDSTAIRSVAPLYDLDNLRIIYADNSGIGDAEAFRFREKNPGCVIIYKTNYLKNWWQYMPDYWKEYFSSTYDVSSDPSKEQLHQLLFLDSLSITEKGQIETLNPISIIKGLQSLSFSGTKISDISPLLTLSELKTLNFPQNPISDITALSGLTTLENINFANTPVSDLNPLSSLTNIKVLNCSGTQIKNIGPLARLIKLEKIEINNTAIRNLKPLTGLGKLNYISCFNTRISTKNIAKFRESKPTIEVVFY